MDEAIFNYNSAKDSACDHTSFANHFLLPPEVNPLSNSDENFKNTVSFDNILCFVYDENIASDVDFDSGITLQNDVFIKVLDINRERSNNSTSSEKIV